MGQTSSSAFQTSPQPLYPSRKRNAPQPPNVTSPVDNSINKSQIYAVAENKVLPNGAVDMVTARKLLRPVSQELSKYHPEFAEIFQSSHATDPESKENSFRDENTSDLDIEKENFRLVRNAHDVLGKQTKMHRTETNHAPQTSNSINISSSYKNTQGNYVRDRPNSENSVASITNPTEKSTSLPSAASLARTQSMTTVLAQPVTSLKHRRQTSAVSAGNIHEHVILEDPREHLYNAARNTPFSNYHPSTMSLPLKSTFDIDYSMNLTYAQLAEYRRNNRLAELEQKTGKKLQELEAEISASSTLPKSPFDLQNLGGKSNTHSISTNSSDTGVSKSKKQRAPEPPKLHPTTKHQITGISISDEPLPDYNMKNITSESSKLPGKSLQRSMSSASTSSKRPAPQPFPKSVSSVNLHEIASSVTQQQENDITSSATLPRLASNKHQSADSSKTKSAFSSNNISVQESLSLARQQLEALTKLKEVLKRAEPTEEINENNSASNMSTDDITHDSDDKVSDINSKDTVDIENRVSDINSKDTVDNENRVSDINSKDTVDNAENTAHKISPLDRMTLDSTKFQREELDQVRVISTELNESEPRTEVANQSEVNHAELHQLEVHQTHVTVKNLKSASEKNNANFITSDSDKQSFKKMNPTLQNETIFDVHNKRNNSNIGDSSVDNFKNPHNTTYDEISYDTREYKQKYVYMSSETHEESQSQIFISRQNENEKRKTDYTELFPSSIWKFEEEKPFQLGDVEQYGRSRDEIGTEISKRSSIQSEDMSISSSNTSQRVFSPDWTPEHDLDSDDDILDDQSWSAERKLSNEWFKPTIISSRISDMKEGKANRSSKKDKRVEKRDEVYPFTEEKTKIGSIRKFNKNMHKGMKNVFGSISKVSGSLVHKQKSQDILDNREAASQISAYSIDGESRIHSNSNWILTSSHNGSLRRAISDDYVAQRNVHEADDLDSSQDPDDEIRDIDFAAGINYIPTVQKSSGKILSEEKQNWLKPAGVAYVDTKGKIAVLPENHNNRIDENSRTDNVRLQNEEKAQNVLIKKEKRSTYDSNLSLQEKYKADEMLEKNISENQQYKEERLRQHEVEINLGSLGNADQGYIRNIQTSNIQETMTQLQQQQAGMQVHEVNYNTAGLSSLNDLTTVTSGLGMSTAFGMNTQVNVAPYVLHSNGPILQTGYIDRPIHIGQTIPFGAQIGSQFPYNIASFPTATFGHQAGVMSNIIDPALYSVHPASFLGEISVNALPNQRAVPNLTPQELAYLSNYMRMIGVQPPANQQQWAVLLSTLAFNSSEASTINQLSGKTAFTADRFGADLSNVFGNSKTVDSLTTGPKSQTTLPCQQYTPPWEISPVKSDTIAYNPLQISNQPGHQQITSPNNINNLDILKYTQTSIHRPQEATSATTVKSTNDVTLTQISSSSIVHNSLPSEENKTNIFSMNFDPNVDTQISKNVSDDKNIPTQSSTRTTTLSSKLYGHIGYRPVSFQPRSPR